MRRRVASRTYRRMLRVWSPAILLTLAVATVGFSFAGLTMHWLVAPDPELQGTPFDRWTRIIYESGQILLLNMQVHEPTANALMGISRLLAVTFVVWLGFTAIRELFHQSWQRFRLVRMRLPWWRWKQLHVVCGLGRIGQRLTSDLLARGHTVVVIEHRDANHVIRRFEELGAIVVRGDASDPELLREWGLEHAQGIYLVTGDDLVNVETLAEVRAIRASGPSLESGGQNLSYTADSTKEPIQCLIHVSDPRLEQTLDHRLRGARDPIDLIAFNIFDRTARVWIRDHLTPRRPRTLEQVGLVVMFGLGNFGRALLKNLVELAHFENRRRLRVLILDQGIEAPARAIASRWGQMAPWRWWSHPSQIAFEPAADDWGGKVLRPEGDFQIDDRRAIEYAANVQYCELPGHVADRSVIDHLHRLFTEPGCVPVVVSAFDHDEQSFAAAVELHAQLKSWYGYNASPDRQLPIFAYLPKSDALQQSLSAEEAFPVRGFSDCRESVSLEALQNRLVEELARVMALSFHDRYAAGPDGDARHEDADSAMRRIWNGLSAWERFSNLQAAEHFFIKLQMLNIRSIAPGDTSTGRKGQSPPLPRLDDAMLARMRVVQEVEHYRYVAERLMQGWQWGPVKTETPPRRPNLCTIRELQLLGEPYAGDIEKDWNQIETGIRHLLAKGFRFEPMTEPKD